MPYHAGLPDEQRSANQDKFIRDEVRAICATTAFGMGIDKPDVRFLVHSDLPKSLEQYYQEVGRAGRDDLPARALLLFAYGDAMKIRSLLSDRGSDVSDDARALAAEVSLRGMLRYAEGSICRRSALLSHFGEKYGREDCGSCDICAGTTDAAEEKDVTTQAYKFLSCVKRTGERYGAGHVVDVLLGSKNERVLGLGHAGLSTWGIGKEWTRGQWLDLSSQLLRKGYLAKNEEYGVLSLTGKTLSAFRDKTSISAFVPSRAAKGRSGLGARSRDSAASTHASEKAEAKMGTFAPGSREAALETALRALRRRLAGDAKVPNYMIFSDRTLYDLIAKAPSDRAALLGIFGMGEVKARRYGSEILEALTLSSRTELH